ncbi:MAG: methyltransferase domain-containing protein [Chitinivibrionales bacterium]|nr:methyltransferase domain-containing protein [Chitinivibrionales bacterium]
MELPNKLNVGSGRDFQEDCINIDIDPYWHPDVVFNLNEPFPPPEKTRFTSGRFGEIEFTPGMFDSIIAHDVLEHLRELPVAMTSFLHLLKEEGTLIATVPYDLSYGAWQDPTHIRAFNERSWAYYTDWYWYVGWTDYRFDTRKLSFGLSEIGEQLRARGGALADILRVPRAVDTMSIILAKVKPNEQDRHLAGRAMKGYEKGR